MDCNMISNLGKNLKDLKLEFRSSFIYCWAIYNSIKSLSELGSMKYLCVLENFFIELWFFQEFNSDVFLINMGAFRGELWGLSRPGPVKSIDFRGFSGPNGC